MTQENHTLWSIKNFKMLIIHAGFGRYGFSSFDLVIIWVVLFLTHSPFLSGLADGMLSFPLFLSFFVGAYIDRTSKKKQLAILSGFARALSMLMIFVGIILRNEFLIILFIFLSAFLIGFTSDVLNSIRASWTKEFLDQRLYKAGTSAQSSVYSAAEGAGYISAGILISFGLAGSFLALFLVFSISIIPLIMITNLKKVDIEDEEILLKVKEGIKFIKSNAALSQIMLITFIGNFVLGMGGVIFAVLVQMQFHMSSFYFSLIFGFLLLGIVFGSTLARSISGRLGTIFLFTFLVIGFSLVSIYFINIIMLILVPAFIIGITTGILNVAAGSALLKIIPQDLMARVEGAFSTFSVGVVAFSGMIGGTIVQLVGYSYSFILLGAVIVIISPLSVIFKSLKVLVI